MIHLFCPSTSELKLGPSAGGDIVFHLGFAHFDPEARDKNGAEIFVEWEKWVAHSGTPYIEVLPGDEQVPTTDLGALSCPICEETETPRAFKTKAGLGSHLRTHEGA